MPVIDIYSDSYTDAYGVSSSVYTTNYCPNPAFQNGITGYAGVNGANVSLSTANILYGPASLLVTCPGLVAGEGASTATATVTNTATGSASCFLNGVGTVTVSAVQNGNVVAVQQVVLSQVWTRTVIAGLTINNGDMIYLTVETTTPNSAQFYLSGVQVEDTSPAHVYCDGDQPGCNWISGNFGVSQQPYFNPVVVTSYEITGAPDVLILASGATSFGHPIISVEHTYTSLVPTGSLGPSSAVTDFSVSALTDPDPAQTYVSWNNSNLTNSASAWSQSWATFIPPNDYLVSGGQVLYKRAAYAGLGWDVKSAAQNNFVWLDKAQARLMPMTTGLGAPAAPGWDNPRTIQSIIVADRINFVTNPSFEVSTANWTALGSATLAQDGTVSVGTIGMFDDTIVTTGTNSCNVTLHANSDGAAINVGNLIAGYTYIASAYVQSGLGLSNILMAIGSGSTSVQSVGGTGYNYGAYNAGPYGGFNPTTDLPTGTWYRVWCIFTATSATQQLTITCSQAADVSYPTHMWIDAVLVEQGEILKGYFDGSAYGPNYSWDSVTGSAGLARSYFYDQMQVKQQAVNNVLTRHTPYGISFDPPVYSVPPIQ